MSNRIAVCLYTIVCVLYVTLYIHVQSVSVAQSCMLTGPVLSTSSPPLSLQDIIPSELEMGEGDEAMDEGEGVVGGLSGETGADSDRELNSGEKIDKKEK